MDRKSRVEQFEAIRVGYRAGSSIRELARAHRVHRRTVRAAIASAAPPRRKTPARESPVTGPWEELVRGWLRADLDAPRKQRHTARRVWQRLVEEHGARVSESAVRGLVARLKVEVGLKKREVMIVQEHLAGAEAEVDFGECQAVLGGEVERIWVFHLRLSHSGKAVHIPYTSQSSESFLDGHVRAFEVLGGVPARIRYDNLKPAVLRVLLGRERLEHPAFVTLRSHYGFESFYCIPGADGAHEKGGVEGEVGRFRRRHLTPVPHVGSLAALAQAFAAADARDDARRIEGRPATVGAMFAAEQPHLYPLPDEAFKAVTRFTARVDNKARVCVRQSYYSVPARFAGGRVDVELGATAVTLRDGAKVIAEHARSLHKNTQDLVLDHYLEVLTLKPGALPGSTALAQARAAGVFTGVHQGFWDAARVRLGDRAGTIALIEALLLYRTLPAVDVTQALAEATRAQLFTAEVIAVNARHLAAARRPSPPPVPVPADADRATIDRPVPDLTVYDRLLKGASL